MFCYNEVYSPIKKKMSITIDKGWEFETLDFSIYNHIVNQEKIKWFVKEYNLSSEFNPLNPRVLNFISFSSKSLFFKNEEIISVLIYSRYVTEGFYLELFRNSEKNWKIFLIFFDFLINPDLDGGRDLKKASQLLNKTKCELLYT